MIYEFQIELFDENVPAQRMLEVDASISLHQFHYIIQTAFGWSAIMPHLFILHEGHHSQAYGDRKFLRHAYLEFYRKWSILDEKKQSLSQCFKQPGDAMTYEYFQNYRTNRYHLIELVTIKEAEGDKIYPYCSQAHYLNPREPYTTRISRTDLDINHANVDSLPSIINQLLLKEESIISEPYIHREEFYRQKLFKTSLLYYMKRPWEYIAEDQMFAVVEFHSSVQLFCSVNGHDGREPGLSVFVGEDSFIELNQTAANYDKNQSAMDILNNLYDFYGIGLIFKEKQDIPDDYLNPTMNGYELWPKDALRQIDHLYPLYFAYQSNKASADHLTVKEMRWLILALKQAMEVADLVKEGLKLPSINDSEILLERSFSYRFQQFINNEIKLIRK